MTATRSSGEDVVSAFAAANFNNHQRPGIEVRRFRKRPTGFVDAGVVQVSDPQDWPTFDPEQADRLLAAMGWRRLHPWIDSAGTRVARVSRGSG